MLIVSRFQSINPNKDSGSVKGIVDLKNEVKIITSLDALLENAAISTKLCCFGRIVSDIKQ